MVDRVTVDEFADELAAHAAALCLVIRDTGQPPLHQRLAAQRLGELVGRLLALAARSGFSEILETNTSDRNSND